MVFLENSIYAVMQIRYAVTVLLSARVIHTEDMIALEA
jgi:hypothetical protein